MDFLTNQNIIFYILAYLLGSVPFGLILAKVFAGVDIKQSGSKSIGATNVLRVVKEKDPKLAKKLGLATVILDAIKVTFILLIAMAFDLSNETLWMIAVLGVLGHCYSIFLGLEGGKGVATGLGAYIVLIPISTIIAAIVWAICAKVLKISSLSSLIALIALLISANFIYDGLNIGSNVPMYLIAFIVFYKHIPNIVRLLKGQEKKVV
ncbi:glycerol-3-phosphate 1-O-acyltransferase PlsY [Aliarcobacter thereius]|uniref:Glycerol-3-phosphate acyltransferase n=1 Tax=Aliarcobacter thereius LMG 24486 TaxID=1032240 RepID=A0A1C7WLY5_9BACT|nr:glycerol-3-phosphate 1-O-acyltransferase PlsY [Aliarcobacter thereius]OCL92128.1 Glycerol-3-phosphate acyltransferase [Aliarcobacter thereius]OCL94776.1 Glycerol-3-phosphate acyltransferase [Aliarcobacter thereius LMG 24486]QBF15348.1 acyl phosphate:glycerol-3-phosphate acyltransferase [Aliarcobacter thereius LMG 24486]TLS93165.1 glycerol-3-phosphate 1-O-acyltransferase PlsY [Aliarcobacter thereius]HJE03629.1 glycerol-3-phosphate 1-O-acyltransferase PlsY [Aliarcobacter thereius]